MNVCASVGAHMPQHGDQRTTSGVSPWSLTITLAETNLLLLFTIEYVRLAHSQAPRDSFSHLCILSHYRDFEITDTGYHTGFTRRDLNSDLILTHQAFYPLSRLPSSWSLYLIRSPLKQSNVLYYTHSNTHRESIKNMTIECFSNFDS